MATKPKGLTSHTKLKRLLETMALDASAYQLDAINLPNKAIGLNAFDRAERLPKQKLNQRWLRGKGEAEGFSYQAIERGVVPTCRDISLEGQPGQPGPSMFYKTTRPPMNQSCRKGSEQQ